jgi:phage shock protein A
MAEQDPPDPKFDAMTSRLLRREALRRAAEELNTTSPQGLEDVLARISAEVTADADARVAEHDGSTISSAGALRSKN